MWTVVERESSMEEVHFVIALLRYPTHPIQLTHSKCKIQCFFFLSILRVVQPQSILECLHHSKKKPYTHYQSLPISPWTHSPRQPLIYSLFPYIYLFWMFHMNGIIRYAIACDRLLSFRIIFLELGFFFFLKHQWLIGWGRIIFLRFIHVITCINTSFILMAK